MCSLDGRSRPYQRRLRYAAYVTIIFLASMVLAYFGQPASAWVAYWNGSENNASYAQLIQSLKVVGKLGASFYIPSWGVSICQVVYAAFVLRKHKAGAATRQVRLCSLLMERLNRLIPRTRLPFYISSSLSSTLFAGSSSSFYILTGFCPLWTIPGGGT